MHHAFTTAHSTMSSSYFCIIDEFSIACALEETYILLYDKLDLNWQIPMSCYGMMKHFN
jgi:hypothetical protein